MRTFNRIMTASLMAIVAISSSSCYVRISKEAKEEIKQKLHMQQDMNEVVYSESDSLVISPGSFNALSSESSVDVTFIQSDCEPKVVIKGKYKSRDHIRVENKDGNLNISYEENVFGIVITHGEEVTVYAPGIESLSNRGSGDVLIKGTLEACGFEILNIGSGDIEFEDALLSGPLSMTNQGSGDIEIDRCRIDGSLIIFNRGSGDITIKGNAGETTVTNQGSGDVDISRLETTSLEVTSKGSGDVIKR